MGFWVTSIKYVQNLRNVSMYFSNQENSGNNRQIDPGDFVDVGNCWIPWCFKKEDFPHRHIEILNESTGNVEWNIWQQARTADHDTIICASSGWFVEPGPAIPGASEVGQTYILIIGPGDNELKTSFIK